MDAVGGDTDVCLSGEPAASPSAAWATLRTFEVDREAALREFPEEPPLAQTSSPPATDDPARAVIHQVMIDSNGFVGQEKGTEIVRLKPPGFPKKRAMQLVKELTGNDKPRAKGAEKIVRVIVRDNF